MERITTSAPNLTNTHNNQSKLKMKTITTETRKFCASVAKNCEKLAKSKPKKSIRRIVIKPIQGGGKLDVIGVDSCQNSYLPSEFIAEVFAIKEDGHSIYSAITYE